MNKPRGKGRIKKAEGGFTLIEVMISMAMGVFISGALIQIMVSSTITEKFNRAIATTQESGRFIIGRLRNEVLIAGLHDQTKPSLNVDVVDESDFVRNHPIVIPNTFVARTTLGSLQGSSGANDTLVISLQSNMDCRSYELAYQNDEVFYVVNEYFVSDNKLRCRGFDGRYLRGQKLAQGHNSHNAITILDGVVNFQVTYGLTDKLSASGSGIPTRYISADNIQAEINKGKSIVALRIALVIKAGSDIRVNTKPSFKLLNEVIYTPEDKALHKLFETTISLRNMKNFVRSKS